MITLVHWVECDRTETFKGTCDNMLVVLLSALCSSLTSVYQMQLAG